LTLSFGHVIATSTTWGTTTILKNVGTVTIKSGTTSIEIYILPPEAVLPATLTYLTGNIGIGIEINAYGTSGAKIGTVSLYVEIHYKEELLGNVDEETLRLWVSSDGINWEEVIPSGVDTDRNIVFGTVTHLSYIAPAGELKFAKDLSNAFAYPNPYYANKHECIWFGEVTQDSIIKIFTIAGKLVCEIKVEDCPQRWDVKKKSLSSGIYIYLIKDPVGNKKVGKLGIIK
jgi:hypothetical protein